MASRFHQLHKISFFGVLLCLLYSKSTAQNDSLPQQWMKPLVYVGLENGNLKSDESLFLVEIKQKEILKLQPRTTADLLSKNGNVFVQKSQFGGGSPVLRGFEANRILLIVDGVRMNNLIYRGGHLQNIITCDVNQLEKMEVIFGPSSCLFGSDALGGVIEMETISPRYQSNKKWRTIIQNRYETVTNGWMQHFETHYGKRNFASLTSFTMQQNQRYLTGKRKNPFFKENFGTQTFHGVWNGTEDVMVLNDDVHEIKNTAYTQTDFLQKFKWRKGKQKNVEHNFQFQHSNTTNINRNDRLSEWNGDHLKFGEWYYGPQKRSLLSYHRIQQKPYQLFQRNDLIVSLQQIEESRQNRKWNSPWLESRKENVGIASITQNFYSITEHHEWQMGWDYQYNQLISAGQAINKISQEQKQIGARYPTGKNNMQSISVYSVHTYRPNQKWTFHDGLRGGYSSLFSEFDDRYTWLSNTNDVQQNMPYYSGSIGAQYHLSHKQSLTTQLSSGYRVPNIDDLSRIFETAQGNIIVPNSNLQPEQSMNIDFGYKWIGEKFQWHLMYYQAWIEDIIALAPFSINGSNTLIWDGVSSNILANQNFESAIIKGLQGQCSGIIGSITRWQLQGQWTDGVIDNDKNQPLDHIPPGMLGGSINQKWKEIQFMLQCQYYGWKKISDYRLNAEDNENYAPAAGTPAYFLIDTRVEYPLSSTLTIYTGIDNLLDTQYRPFASGINGPGRNFYLSIRWNP
jgi:hemoglobin/transferrin/lactoferrin receptor protein